MADLKSGRRGLTLAEAAREFWRHPTPWLLSAALIAAVVARAAVGGWQYTDAVLAMVVLAVFPFFEWMIHVFILHWRPRKIAGVMVDPLLARKHREHHIDPRIVKLIFIPLQSLFGALAAGLIVAVWAFPRIGLGLTFLAVLFAIGVTTWSTPITNRKPPSTGRCTATTGGTTTRTKTTGLRSPLPASPIVCWAPIPIRNRCRRHRRPRTFILLRE